jgi:CheY-like chemotaxis protein
MKKKLLVVDENTTIQRVIKLAFREEPIQVITVARGRDVFEQIEENPPDIVLAENGREVAAFLKSQPRLSRIPVVLLRGAFDEALDGVDDAQGCDAVLMKPLQPHALIDRVKSLLARRARATRRTPAPITPITQAPSFRPVDPELELDRYFDGLAAAFSNAEIASAPPDDGWIDTILPPAGVTQGPRMRQTSGGDVNVPTAATRNVPTKNVPKKDAPPEEFIDTVTQRVLDRLTEGMTRATATEMVARLSKWLLVDEVERSRA